LVINLVRGKTVDDALSILEATQKKAAEIIAKTVRSAVANAEDTQNVDVDRGDFVSVQFLKLQNLRRFAIAS
jgi:large subunit ribosomal protein L22